MVSISIETRKIAPTRKINISNHFMSEWK